MPPVTTLGPVTKLPPRRPGHYLFVGKRTIRNALHTHLAAPVQVVEYRTGRDVELAVCLLGMARRFPIAVFEGTWRELIIELETEV